MVSQITAYGNVRMIGTMEGQKVDRCNIFLSYVKTNKLRIWVDWQVGCQKKQEVILI